MPAGQFGAAHVIENLLVFLQAFAGVYVPCNQTAIEAGVLLVLKNGVIAGLDDARPLGGIGQLYTEIGSVFICVMHREGDTWFREVLSLMQ